MSVVSVVFQVPADIADGLASGTYERVGGVIRHANTKQVVAWLREIVGQGDIGPDASTMLGIVGSASSVLNLAVTAMGFTVVMQRLGAIQQRLQDAQELLKLLDQKVDLSFYGNLCAALDLATNAFTMTKPDNRKTSAMQAINRFLEAERHYSRLVDLEIQSGSRVADEYLLMLCLAHITEVRCYLELEELGTAHRRLEQAAAELRPRFQQLVQVLLTTNPAAYLHPDLKGQVGLRRLTQVYQWLEPDLDEDAVFEAQRDNLFRLAKHSEAWIDSLPPAFLVTKKGRVSRLAEALPYLSRRLPGRTAKRESVDEDSAAPFADLAEMMDLIEQLIESERRIWSYQTEIEAAQQLGMSFREWLDLAPHSVERSGSAKLMYVLPAEPAELAA